jgi:hypothetical protein
MSLSHPNAFLSKSDKSASSARRKTSVPSCDTTHVYALSDSKGFVWASLEVMSSAKESHHLPSFVEGNSINGSVALNLPKGDSIHSVIVTVSTIIRITADCLLIYLSVQRSSHL